jgi:hypothetical protein
VFLFIFLTVGCFQRTSALGLVGITVSVMISFACFLFNAWAWGQPNRYDQTVDSLHANGATSLFFAVALLVVAPCIIWGTAAAKVLGLLVGLWAIVIFLVLRPMFR